MLGAQDRTDVLVGGRRLVAQRVGEARVEPGSAHLPLDVATRHATPHDVPAQRSGQGRLDNERDQHLSLILTGATADGHAVAIILDDDAAGEDVDRSGERWEMVDREQPDHQRRAGATHDVVINGDVAVDLAARVNVRGLKLTGGASLHAAAAGNRVGRTSGLVIDGRPGLNLGDNDLIFDDVAFTGDLRLPPLSGGVARLVGGGTFTYSGRPTRAAGCRSGLGLTASQTATFSGQTVDGTTVLLKFTYGGDANLDGAVTGDDYSAIEFNVGVAGASGWSNGDFNYDGIISGVAAVKPAEISMRILVFCDAGGRRESYKLSRQPHDEANA